MLGKVIPVCVRKCGVPSTGEQDAEHNTDSRLLYRCIAGLDELNVLLKNEPPPQDLWGDLSSDSYR